MQPVLFSIFARRRAIESWRQRAREAWDNMGRCFMAAWAAELDGHGDPRVTLRWQVYMARVRFYIQRCNAALAQLRRGALCSDHEAGPSRQTPRPSPA